jgi:phospholipid transport system substrate-binding protein
MLTRRMTMGAIGATACLMGTPRLSRDAWAQSDGLAVAFIKTTSEQFAAIVNSTGTPQEKRRQMQGVVDSTMDVDGIAHFCLGRFWRIATSAQQAQYTALFRDLMVIKIVDHLGEYQGVQITIGPARASADTEIVMSTVAGPRTPPRRVDWVVSTATGAPKIVDLLAGGTSLRLTQSADFTAYLAFHDYRIQDLISAMRKMLARTSTG